MTNLKKCIIHIGFHKTGSSSIQHFLKINRDRLKTHGYWFYSGEHIDGNHVELHAASMRRERSSTFKLKSEFEFDEQYFLNTKARLREFIARVGENSAIFSADSLSLLRYADETDCLASMLPRDVSIIAFLRNRQDYRRSHSSQLKRAGFRNVTDKDSHAYMEEDSWMFDYELRLKSYRETFGLENVHIVDYDEACDRDGSIIPSLLSLLNLERSFASEDWQDIRLNQS